MKIYYIINKTMNIEFLKNNWMRYYKRGFFTGIVVLCFLCFIDQTLQYTFFFNKIDNINTLMITLSFIFFGAIFCGMLSLLILLLLSFMLKNKK